MAYFGYLICRPNTKIHERWLKSGKNEFGLMFQGFGYVKGMDMTQFILKSELTQGKNVKYP